MIGKRIAIFITAGFLLALSGPGSVYGQLDGKFDIVGAVPEKYSLKIVVLEEFLNFTCPHCNNFRNASKPIFEKYGDRIRRINRPILFKGQPDHPLRLYFIAEKVGRSHEIKEMIFDAAFKYGVNIYDPKVVGYLARSAGLHQEYDRDSQADWVTSKIQESHRLADQFGVSATPTLVLNGALRLVPSTGMQVYVNNLDRLIAQMLKP